MEILEVERFFETVQADKTLIALGLDEVRYVDRTLGNEWDIRFRDHASLKELLGTISNKTAVDQYMAAHEAVAAAKMSNNVEGEAAGYGLLYEALANEAVLGPVTSQRRHYIIDSICMSIGLARVVGPSAKVLDAGCHAGFTSLILAEHVGEIVGIDPSASAIDVARRRAVDRDNVRFDLAMMPSSAYRGFDLVLAIDAMPLNRNKVVPFLRSVSESLRPGGLALIASAYWRDAEIDITRRQLRGAGLGFGYADVVGGYGDTPLRFMATGTLVLVKGGKRELPRKLHLLMESEWAQFRDYANAWSTPPHEKTQAFERSLRRQPDGIEEARKR